MGIAIIIQNQAHRRVELIAGEAAEVLYETVSNAPPKSLIRGIHPHADTMFNSAQLRQLIDELDATVARGQVEQELIATLRAAAESAIRQRGYLWFSGD